MIPWSGPAADATGRAVEVWPVQLRGSGATISRLRALLSDDELERALRFRGENLQHAYILARGALRLLLAHSLGRAPAEIDLAYEPAGKPFLPGSLLNFNVSHSGQVALYAFTRRCEVGVDVECMRSLPDMHDIAHRFFHPAEVVDLLALPEDQRARGFFDCWARKEAYMKATGLGLSTPLDSFRVHLAPGEARLVECADGGACEWSLHDLQVVPGYAAALAYRDRPRPVWQRPLARPSDLFELGWTRCA